MPLLVSRYNPQNEMLLAYKTKRNIIKNEMFPESL